MGRPDTLKVTGTGEPVSKCVVMDEEGLVEPCTTVRLLGEGMDRLKSKVVGCVTVTVTVVGVVVAPRGEPVTWTL